MKASSRGFSLVEVLIAIGVLGVVGAATTTLIVNNMKAVQAIAGRVSESVLIADINQIIADKDLCKSAFTNAGNSPLVFTTYKAKIQASGYGILQEGLEVQNAIRLDKFEIRDFGTPEVTTVPNQRKVLGTLYIQTSNLQGDSIQRKEKIVSTFGLYYDDTTKVVQSCYGASAIPQEELCRRLGMNWDSRTLRCKQTPLESCGDVGGTWQAGKCVLGGAQAGLSIFGVTCGGTQFLAGYSSNGTAICRDMPAPTVIVQPAPVYNPQPTQPPAPIPSPRAPAETLPVPVQISVSLSAYGPGQVLRINLNVANGTAGAPVTFTRSINGSQVQSGTVGTVMANGSFSYSDGGSGACLQFSAPCRMSVTVCSSGSCASDSVTVPKDP